MPPMTLISIGLPIPVLAGVTYAIPDAKVTLESPATVQYTATVGGAFADYTAPTVIRWGFIKPLTNTTVKLKKIPWKKTTTPPVADSPLLTNLVSYWSFNTNFNDQHGANHLTNNNAVTRVAGKNGQAADFEKDTTQYLSYTDPAPFGDIDFTCSLWFKRESFSADAVPFGGGKAFGLTLSTYFFLIGADGRLFFMFGDGGVNAYTPTTPYNDTNWHHVIGWHDAAANTINLQVDGGAVFSSNTGGAFPSSIDGPSGIGRGYYSNVMTYFDGLIDEVGLWRRLLTPAERTALYNAGNGVTYPFTGI